MVSEFNLTSDAATRVYPDSSTPILHRHLASARTILKANGLIDNSERGVWRLTAEGLRTETVDATSARAEYRRLRRERRLSGGDQESVESDDEVVEGSEIWRDDLLRVLREMAPDGFERLCQRLLRESGFIKVSVTGRSGDGGIDGHGIIRLVGLISFPVMFQCKRYSSNVPAREIRDFRGAMQGRSEKGIFFTTSDFTPDARKEATRSGVPLIDLIDGKGLTDLLMQLELGVKPTQRTVEADVDISYFKSI